jgi:uncharacterized membrane protein YdbT with pleckstrin-like domain
MNPQDPAHYNPQYDPTQKVGNELTVSRPGEKFICEVKRHPIGIVGIYIAISLILITIAIIAFGVVPSLTNESGNSGLAAQIGAIVFLFILVFSAIFGFISHKVYWGNSWVVTSDSVTQIAQTSLFNRQSSQLALHNIEDVTAEQNGILAQMLNYGVIKAETAGKRAKFVFPYCPNPNYYAKCILEAREAYEMHAHGQRASEADALSQPINY